MKKLEPGCKAITVNCEVPENNGIVVTVIGFVGKVEGWVGKNRWAIDKPLKGLLGGYTVTAKESQLQRIDDKEETTTWEAMRGLWVPEQIKTVHKVTE